MTETVIVKDWQKTCAERIQDMWNTRREDIKNPEFEGLAFDYVEPHTFTDQLEGYWRWQFSWGGPSDELRAFVNEHKEIHRLEYWFMDWMDGAKIDLTQERPEWSGLTVGPEWQRMQDYIEASL
jgi:hypothetical protein